MMKFIMDVLYKYVNVDVYETKVKVIFIKKEWTNTNNFITMFFNIHDIKERKNVVCKKMVSLMTSLDKLINLSKSDIKKFLVSIVMLHHFFSQEERIACCWFSK